MAMIVNSDNLVGPGDILVNSSECEIGSCCYLSKTGEIRSSVYGQLAFTNNNKIINVIPYKTCEPIIELGATVFCKAQKIFVNQLSVEIVAIGDTQLKYYPKGIIKREEMMNEGDLDLSSIPELYRPGDIIRAEISSLGDNRQYYLRTNRDDLGVIYAKSITGRIMTSSGNKVSNL